MTDLKNQRIEAAEKSLGTSNDYIQDDLFKIISRLGDLSDKSIIDVGVGDGTLLKNLKNKYPEAKLSGVDIRSFFDSKSHNIEFYERDLNDSFSQGLPQFDLVVASHVLLYLENPWHFFRELANLAKPGGKILFANPNPERWTSFLSFWLRGHYDMYHPRFPGHICSITRFELDKIINSVEGLRVEEFVWTYDGRVPGTNLLWRKCCPFLKGKRYAGSLNFLINKG